MLNDERVLVTGGAGFIGTRLTKRLAAKSEVLSFDSLHPQVHGLRPAPLDIPNVIGDVADFDALQRVITFFNPTTIYHLAAETGTGQSWDEPGRYCNVNIAGTTNLIEAVRQAGSKVRRIVLASSRAVYGEGAYLDGDLVVCGEPRKTADMARGDFFVKSKNGTTLVPIPTPEDITVKPASVYASSKLMQEYLLVQCFEGTETEVNCLRFQNVYGAGQSLKNPYTGVISIFCEQILDGRKLNIFEDGEIIRDFIHVSDVVAALEKFSQSGKVFGSEPINIGSGQPESILNMARTLLEKLGRDQEMFEVTGKFRAGDVRYAVGDISRARQVLDWAPQLSFDKGLSEFTQWASS